MPINSTEFAERLSQMLHNDGVPWVESKQTADQFVRTLKRDHADWFEQPKIKLEEFVLARIAEQHLGITNSRSAAWLDEMKNIVSNYQYLGERRGAVGAISSFQQRGQRQSYEDVLRRYARLFSDHPDYERIEK